MNPFDFSKNPKPKSYTALLKYILHTDIVYCINNSNEELYTIKSSIIDIKLTPLVVAIINCVRNYDIVKDLLIKMLEHSGRVDEVIGVVKKFNTPITPLLFPLVDKYKYSSEVFILLFKYSKKEIMNNSGIFFGKYCTKDMLKIYMSKYSLNSHILKGISQTTIDIKSKLKLLDKEDILYIYDNCSQRLKIYIEFLNLVPFKDNLINFRNETITERMILNRNGIPKELHDNILLMI